MANYNTTLRNAIASRVVQNLDVLEILDADNNVLISFTGLVWSTPSNGVVQVMQAENNALPYEKYPALSGTAASARLKHSGASGEEIQNLTVGTSNANVVLGSTTLDTGVLVRLQSLQFTQSDQVTT